MIFYTDASSSLFSLDGNVMSRRLSVPPAPGPLEAYACAFDDLFSHRSQRDPFRRYLEGRLLPSERNKTFTGLG